MMSVKQRAYFANGNCLLIFKNIQNKGYSLIICPQKEQMVSSKDIPNPQREGKQTFNARVISIKGVALSLNKV